MPAAPVVLPEVSTGAAAELDALREAISLAFARVSPSAAALVAPGTRDHVVTTGGRGSLRGLGVEREFAWGDGSAPMPLALTVGAALCPLEVVAMAEILDGTSQLPDAQVLVVLGEGCATLTEKSPGYVRDGSAEFNAMTIEALANADVDRLAALDLSLAQEFWCSGAPVWAWVARSLRAQGTTNFAAELLHESAPYGVSYPVVLWQG